MADKPSVFISYARSDGETFAQDLYEKIERAGIPCWLDRVKMKGGESWWRQIQEALDQVEFFVLVMTPGGIESNWTRKEWLYARQQGVCVFPVIAADDLDFGSLPRWMNKTHFYDLSHPAQWTKFINDLNTRCEQPHVPFMVEDKPDIFIDRPVEFEKLVDSLLDEKRENPKAITTTTALKGAGGFGKTTLAIALCHDDRIQQAFSDGILWVTLGEHPGDLVGRVSDLIVHLTGENPGYTTVEAASARLAELLADRDLLMVIDDVWDSAHLRPFLRGGERCTRLITTRDSATLPAVAIRIDVDEMRHQEAVDLLKSGLPDGPEGGETAFHSLSARLGEWPLLLKLVNARLRDRVLVSGQSLDAALAYIDKALDKRGITAFDIGGSADRHNAVDATLGLSLELLNGGEAARFLELTIFPEDADIPLDTLAKYWGRTAGLDELDAEDLCERYSRLSLLQVYNLATRTIRMHDVVRGYLAGKAGPAIPGLHATFLASYGLQRWADLPEDEPYLWDQLTYHQRAARQSADLCETVKDFYYLAKKTWIKKSYAVEKDLQRATNAAPEDETLKVLYRNYRNSGHLFNRCQTLKDVSLNLIARFVYVDKVKPDFREAAKLISPPHLFYSQPPPDLPHPALIRTLASHTGDVYAVALSQDGGTIISGSEDKTVRAWDANSGELRHTLEGHTGDVTAVVLSRDGDMIVSSSLDNMVRVWDAQSGELRSTLEGHTGGVTAVVLSRDGDTIVSGGWDSTVRVWDANSGELRSTLEGHTAAVKAVVLSRNGDMIVSGSLDSTVRVWDANSGELRHTLEGHHSFVNAVALSWDGVTIVSGSDDGTVRVWDAASGELRHTLEGHTAGVRDVVVSRDGGTIISGSVDRTLRVWDAKSGKLRHNLVGQPAPWVAIALSWDGDVIVSGSADNTVRVWDAASGELRHTLEGHTAPVRAVKVSRDGGRIVSVSEDKTVRVWDISTSLNISASSGEVQRTLADYTAPVRKVVVSQDGDTIVSGSDDKMVRVWDAASGELQRTLIGHADWVNAVVLSWDGGTIVSSSLDNSVRVWDTQSGELRYTLKGTDWVNAVVLSWDGGTIVSGFKDGTVRVWDAKSGELQHTLADHTRFVTAVVLSQDGGTIVSGSDDETVRVWDAKSGELRHTLEGHTAAVNTVVLSRDGGTIVSGSDDMTVRVWDAKSGELRHTLEGHTGLVNAVALSQDGGTIVSGSDDKTVRVWDAQSGEYFCGMYTEGRIFDVKCDLERNLIVAGGAGGLYFMRFVR